MNINRYDNHVKPIFNLPWQRGITLLNMDTISFHFHYCPSYLWQTFKYFANISTFVLLIRFM